VIAGLPRKNGQVALSVLVLESPQAAAVIPYHPELIGANKPD
jgi:hypothetical protein